MNFFVTNRKNFIYFFISFILLISISIYIFSRDYICIEMSNSIENYLKEQYGESYVQVYDYRIIGTLFDYNIVRIDKGVSINLPNLKGSNKLDSLYKCIDYMNNFDYTGNQPNPNKIPDVGGNCQAFSIYFNELCANNDIECRIIQSDTHSYNQVVIDGRVYKVDLVYSIIEEE